MSFETPDGYDGPVLERLAESVPVEPDVESAASDAELRVRAPFTDAVVGTVPACSPDAIRGAVDRARTAQADWKRRPASERVAAIERFEDLIHDHRAELLDLVQLESGKTRYDALEECGDVEFTAGHYAERTEAYLEPERHPGLVPGLTRVREHHDPYGVVGIVSPWNYPLTLAISDALPALLAGNAVVLKPAEQTPFTALYVEELLAEAGVPSAVFQVVPGRGETLGPPLIDAVDAVNFTGSTAVGREVAAQAAESLIPATLELGGKGPMIVREDAPLGRTVTGALRGAFASAGQLCIAVERIYVHESIADEFTDRLVERVRGLDLGTEFTYAPDVGSMVSADQLERVEAHVDDAVADGASLLTGGRRRPDVGPLVYEPTVLGEVPPGADVTCEETFGPVVTVTPVPDDETAIELANDTPYGLHGSVWTDDTAAGRRVARRLDCGTVCVNDAYMSMWGSTSAPMGGRKDSGLGRRHGDQGFEKYTRSQSVTVQHGHPLTPISAVPNRVTAWALAAYLRVVRGLGIR
ncbi:succinic semialdehyde dehydrogenase [Salinarchaeum sp. Harcht-Bsk1]|uniref:succinic semialdehyde dehydrogenase n=1 Tax=Salinarchaeum sp. Harcht-Bsk1 TaxID=1333523 RepID=UPI000342313D|nr:succinic semialdehyde dehydrogenase [Salinarchaeum sp. Harcht-Bsk1]AGN00350.1 succinic semialdehyde dehydrogenase [Salinarchaeum sp. Harcht-Bsk1]